MKDLILVLLIVSLTNIFLTISYIILDMSKLLDRLRIDWRGIWLRDKKAWSWYGLVIGNPFCKENWK